MVSVSEKIHKGLKKEHEEPLSLLCIFGEMHDDIYFQMRAEPLKTTYSKIACSGIRILLN